MGLTQSDLQEVRQVVEEVFEPLDNELKALRNDIKELCYDFSLAEKSHHEQKSCEIVIRG